MRSLFALLLLFSILLLSFRPQSEETGDDDIKVAYKEALDKVRTGR